jgi:hypothetical protein
MTSIVQFTHPGSEHGPETPSTDLKHWNTGRHKRKFLAARGQYVSGGNLEEGELMFWGEWEPCSRVERLTQPAGTPNLPKWLHHPLWPCPESCRLPGMMANIKKGAGCTPVRSGSGGGTCKSEEAFCQNTDPYVFGPCFKYFNCKQIRHRSIAPKQRVAVSTKLAQLDPGSMILFGCTRGTGQDARFLLDTVFVVAERIEYDPDLPASLPSRPEIDDVFLNASFYASFPKVGRQPSRGLKLGLYLGAKFGDPSGMYSFSPTMIRNSSGFPRLELRASYFQHIGTSKSILTNNLNSAALTTVVTEEIAQAVWTIVRDKCRTAGCVEGVSFNL